MPVLEVLPNSTGVPPPPPPPKVPAGRFSALDHSEIVHLLSTLDDEVARSRFREAIYLSLFLCIGLAWFALYGPRFFFPRGRIVPVAEQHERKNELSYLEMPKELTHRVPPKPPKVISDETHQAQTAHPAPTQPTPEELQAMRRAGNPGQPAPRPAPPAPQPQQPAPQSQPQQQPTPPTPQPQRPQIQNIPDAPRPSQQAGRPNFNTPTNPADALSAAERNAIATRGQGGENGLNAPRRGHVGANTGVEVLSDTLGTDFGPYIKRLVRATQNAWSPLIPEECQPPLSRTGETLIRFTIQPNGIVSAMHLDDSTHDLAIDKSAWGAITSQGQLPPLPASFKGPNLELRFHFVISHNGNETN